MLSARALKVLVLLTLAAGPAAAQDPVLEARLDGLFQGLMETHRIPGAVLVVVKDGRVVLSRGYGVADLATGRPVDPAETRFRVASISKLFVATAVMQQVERGNLDLDVDVNRYLEGFQVEDAFDEPITLRHLLTHTGGFDDRFIATAQPLEDPPVDLGAYLAERMPPRVMPPGPIISYSNHGYALAGYLVERVSGVPFAEYVHREILEPLGMRHSQFGVPTPLPERIARPYEWKGGRHRDLGFDRLLDAPAGDLLTTGGDMARFMLMQLQGGVLAGRRVLRPESVARMQKEQVRLAEGLPGWCLGFAAELRDGVHGRAHGGSWRGFGTNLTLIPSARLGWFVSTNHDFHGPFFEALRAGLWETFFPAAAPEPAVGFPDLGERAADYTGSYVPNRRVRGTFLKLGQIIQEAHVRVDDEGALVLEAMGLKPRRLRAVGPDRFLEVDGHRRAVFARDSGGRVAHLFVDSLALDRLSPWQAPRNHVLAAAAAAVLFGGTLLGWALGGLARRLGSGPDRPLALRTRFAGAVTSALLLGLLVWLGSLAANPDIWSLMMEVSGATRLALWIPLLTLPVALWLGVEVAGELGRRRAAGLARLHAVLLGLAALIVVAGCFYWNLLPWKI